VTRSPPPTPPTNEDAFVTKYRSGKWVRRTDEIEATISLGCMNATITSVCHHSRSSLACCVNVALWPEGRYDVWLHEAMRQPLPPWGFLSRTKWGGRSPFGMSSKPPSKSLPMPRLLGCRCHPIPISSPCHAFTFDMLFTSSFPNRASTWAMYSLTLPWKVICRVYESSVIDVG